MLSHIGAGDADSLLTQTKNSIEHVYGTNQTQGKTKQKFAQCSSLQLAGTSRRKDLQGSEKTATEDLQLHSMPPKENPVFKRNPNMFELLETGRKKRV